MKCFIIKLQWQHAKDRGCSKPKRIQRADGLTAITVTGDDTDEKEQVRPASSDRDSIRIQAALCRIGEAMGFSIWLPNSDRSRVTEHWKPREKVLLDRLPLNLRRNNARCCEAN